MFQLQTDNARHKSHVWPVSNHTLFSEVQLVVKYYYDSWSAHAKS